MAGATAIQRLLGLCVVTWGLLALAGAAWASQIALAALGVMVLAVSLLRLTAALLSPRQAPPVPLPESALPTYTILVPLYREAAVVPQLVAALKALDYPPRLLQILFLVEADDSATRAALAVLQGSAPVEILVLPDGQPRTKPRALALALPRARGDLLTVYDAEDVPERDQLRRAAAALAASPDIGCLQARLVVDNAEDGWLAAFFALEYAVLFDVLLPGLARLELPLLLGGSSNHFRTATLRAAGGWDPWNVTEDADLGLRLARRGVRVATLASSTREEAPARVKAWLRQRRRWTKGWMQTFIVHTRQPHISIADLGLARALLALAVLANGLVTAVAGLAFALVLVGDLGRGAVPCIWWLAALLGLGGIVVPLALALHRRRLWHLWPVLWLAPLRWLLLTLAAWWALADLWLRPYHWGATRHGLSRRRTRSVDLTDPAF